VSKRTNLSNRVTKQILGLKLRLSKVNLIDLCNSKLTKWHSTYWTSRQHLVWIIKTQFFWFPIFLFIFAKMSDVRKSIFVCFGFILKSNFLNIFFSFWVIWPQTMKQVLSQYSHNCVSYHEKNIVLFDVLASAKPLQIQFWNLYLAMIFTGLIFHRDHSIHMERANMHCHGIAYTMDKL